MPFGKELSILHATFVTEQSGAVKLDTLRPNVTCGNLHAASSVTDFYPED
jgi:hypothetical protein